MHIDLRVDPPHSQPAKRSWLRYRIFVAGLLTCISASAFAQPAGTVTSTLTVTGSVEHEITLSVDDLTRLPVQRIDDVRSVRDASDATGSTESARHYVGCLLRDVLERAKPVEKKRMDFRKSVVIATASDGYRAVFSWAELYLSPLDDSEGRIALVSLKDTRPGPRHVKWLQSVELRTLSK